MGGVGPIPRSKIKEYMIDYGFEGKSLSDLVWIVRTIDRHLTEVIHPAQAKRKAT